MFVDIHRHSADNADADIVIRNLFHTQTNEIVKGKFYSVGLHPWHINSKSWEKDFEKVKNICSKNEVVAIGECGIDKSINCNLDLQIEVFDQHIQLSKAVNKPIIIHCVRAYNEILHLRKHSKHLKPWVFHWFNASYEMGTALINKGCYLSFGHMLFNIKSKTYKSFASFPHNRVFFETDDAEISIIDVYKTAASLMNIPLKQFQECIIHNLKECFTLDI